MSSQTTQNLTAARATGETGINFYVSAKDGNARRGILHTRRGSIDTPAFMPVGTAATVKAMQPEGVAATGTQVILSNTYHLMLRPTAEKIARLGGLHRFMRWPGPILTDSGGFQVMSLAQLRKITEEGVTFKSHIDGSKHALSPERSMEIQDLLGSDIVMCFDECTPYPATHDVAAHSMRMSMRWAQRSKDTYTAAAGRALFGIVQGGVYDDLRNESVEALRKVDFDGYAIGGLAVGEGQEEMFRVLDVTVPMLPDGHPRYLMGVGKPSDIVGAVYRGIDMFDCVLPTRSGRNAQSWTWRGPINLRNARHAEDMRSLDERVDSPARLYSRAYLHHLFRAGEMLGPILLTAHNVQFYQDLMTAIRSAISAGNLDEFTAEFYKNQALGDIDPL